MCFNHPRMEHNFPSLAHSCVPPRSRLTPPSRTSKLFSFFLCKTFLKFPFHCLEKFLSRFNKSRFFLFFEMKISPPHRRGIMYELCFVCIHICTSHHRRKAPHSMEGVTIFAQELSFLQFCIFFLRGKRESFFRVTCAQRRTNQTGKLTQQKLSDEAVKKLWVIVCVFSTHTICLMIPLNERKTFLLKLSTELCLKNDSRFVQITFFIIFLSVDQGLDAKTTGR